METSGRIKSITILRCLALWLVVFGHSLCMYTDKWHAPSEEVVPLWQNVSDIIYLIHMPLFTLIAGYVYWYVRKSGRYDSMLFFIKKKSLRLLVPFLFWGVLECFVDLGGNFSTLIEGPLHLWYLRFVFECFIVTRLFDSWLLQRPFCFLLIAIVFLVFRFFSIPIIDGTFTSLYCYFVLGVFFNSYSYKFRKLRITSWILMLVSFLCMLLCYYHNLKAPLALCALIFNCMLFLSFSFFRLENISPAIISLDGCSMGIYLLHHPIIWNIANNESTRVLMMSYKYIAPVFLSVVVTILCWAITHYVNKTKYLRYILG